MHRGANYTTAFLEPHYIYIIATYAWAFLIKWFIKFSKFKYVCLLGHFYYDFNKKTEINFYCCIPISTQHGSF